MSGTWSLAVTIVGAALCAVPCAAQSDAQEEGPLLVTVKMSGDVRVKGHFEAGAVADDDLGYTVMETTVFRIDVTDGRVETVSTNHDVAVSGKGILVLGDGLPSPTWTYTLGRLDPNRYVGFQLSRSGGVVKVRDFLNSVELDSPFPQEGLTTPYPMAPSIAGEMFRSAARSHSAGPNHHDIEIPIEWTATKRTLSGQVRQSFEPEATGYQGTGLLVVDVTVRVDSMGTPRRKEKCRISVIAPRNDERLIFDDGDPGALEGVASGEVTPGDHAGEMTWEFPGGFLDLSTEPDPPRGQTVRYRFNSLPEHNSAFGPVPWTVKVNGADSECSETTRPRVFYRRDADNKTPVYPNWFLYWRQTSAAQGHEASIEYDPKVTLGFYGGYGDPPNRDTDHIYIGDLRRLNFVSEADPEVNLRAWEGIDLFAAIVRHEWCHLTHYKEWWAATGYKMPDPRDKDEDHIPDTLEKGLGFDPRKNKTLGGTLDDEEVLCYREEAGWKAGSADKEDWGCPGRQCGK